jgi:hypothetical protein
MKPLPNRWETEYERDILWPLFKSGDIVGYHYEGVKLRLADGAIYTPDYFVVYRDHFELHEVKGFWREAARVRIKVAAGLFPYFRFRAVTKAKRGNGWAYEEMSNTEGK